VLCVRGKKADDVDEKSYLYSGIANRSFERKFNLADFIEVNSADLKNGLLTINPVKEVPEAMKPRSIAIGAAGATLEHQDKAEKAA
jgi:molecular chaperone IbpA